MRFLAGALVLCLCVALPASPQQPGTTPLVGVLSPIDDPMMNTTLSYLAFLFSVSIRSLAAGPDEAGFWPVIRRPSATV